MDIILTIILAGGTMLILATAMGFILGWANRAFHVPVDPKQAAIDAALPGANCGGCGYIGCTDYAEAVAKSEAAPNLCPVGGDACTQAIADIMGVDVDTSWPQRPIIHCSATSAQRLGKHTYHGEHSCHAANLVAGIQGCTYGCLGYGDCVSVCTYDAIHIDNGLARIDYEKCVGCGACLSACPRNIISQVPFKAERILAVSCCNGDFGKEVTAICTVGCTGCKACSKASELFTMDGNVPVLNYNLYEPDTDFSAPLDKCPRESLVWIGKPTAKDLVASAGEELPDLAKANFETTVDKTEWRG